MTTAELDSCCRWLLSLYEGGLPDAKLMRVLLGSGELEAPPPPEQDDANVADDNTDNFDDDSTANSDAAREVRRREQSSGTMEAPDWGKARRIPAAADAAATDDFTCGEDDGM